MAHLVLGTLQPESVASVALALLEAGYDTPAIVDLAWNAGGDSPLAALRAALASCGIELPDQSRARIWLAKAIGEKVLAGELSAYQGGKTVWKSLALDPDSRRELAAFIAYASELEDSTNPDDKAYYERALLSEFRALLGVPDPG